MDFRGQFERTKGSSSADAECTVLTKAHALNVRDRGEQRKFANLGGTAGFNSCPKHLG